jgi:D-alanine-D-alanine ligase-like ATP-grasp enzyme
MKHYGLRFAAIDFVVDVEGQWFFLEINPGGQWAWLDIAGVADIASDLARAMTKTP